MTSLFMTSLLMITTHWLSVSLPLMVIPTIVLIIVIAVSPETFRSDWPVDIQRHMAKPTPAEQRNATIAGLVFLVALLGAMLLSALLFALRVDSSFWLVLLSTIIASLTFLILDLVVVDWLVLCWWQPQWILIPGTEHCAGWKDYWFHARVLAQLKVIGVNLLIPLVITTIVWLVVGL